ncbi:hypothetical protein QR680_004813 [Steinernema hermaphroditum]|uniref:Serine/threonine-protein phosphatase n=1 Tax=Steinernema hermaphroditum TaxID=289476 RepID=A0AA39LUA3_9BILA|nr:hypothetical protein QR680_004813 [Steinernema hermaphroditum]
MADVDKWIAQLQRLEKLSAADVLSLCNKTREVLVQEPNVVRLSSPLVVSGDIHGQFADLQQLFSLAGHPCANNYVFLGDYVDRGSNSVECISLLMCLKVKFRERFVLLRGNHECRAITAVYGFYDECLSKYSDTNVWKAFVELFDFLPLSAVIDDAILCVHGGLSPYTGSLDAIAAINRFQEIPVAGPLCDLVWSDPDHRLGWNVSQRNVGVTFGEAISREFTHNNGLNFIARAHEAVQQGYEWRHNGHVVTIFSASNYCNSHNEAAFMIFHNLVPFFHNFVSS